MTVPEKYKDELERVRQNPTLLDNYRFVKGVPNTKHYERLRLNIAIYNDFKQTDYEIVKFLFTEEMEWREHEDKEGDVDNLYFCAFILTFFKAPEVIWLFFETKNIDFDSGIGFDGEYLLAFGITETYRYLKTVEHPLKADLLKYIGETEETCKYSQEDIDFWKVQRRSYFRCYEYPIEDELWFLFSTDERELFLLKFPEWIQQQQGQWTDDKLGSYRTYAKYAGDKAIAIEAFLLTLEKNSNDFLTDIYNEQLAELYIDIGESRKAFDILENVIEKTDNKNAVRNCVGLLCRIVVDEKDKKSEVVQQSYALIKIQQAKYTSFSPNVDMFIKSVTETMTQNDNRPWWKKLLGLG